MYSLNSILLEGVLLQDPAKLKTGDVYFHIATNRFYSEGGERKNEVCHFSIVTRGRTAENCLKTLKKGNGVRVVGRLHQDQWTDDGGEHERVYTIAETVEFKRQFDVKEEAETAES